MTEFSIRWPCPKDTDPEFYEARLSLLMRDCAGIAPAMLRKAGDYIALRPGRPPVIPMASEIVEAVEAIMQARVAKQIAGVREAQTETRGTPLGDKEAAYYRGNATALARDMHLMMTGKGDAFKLGDMGERRGVRRDGSVIEPWFHHAKFGDAVPAGWYCRREDASDLAHCFSRFDAPYRMDGARIVER